jgi:hypothetical protein
MHASRPRAFGGRQLLAVVCAEHGARLATVYPTTRGPFLVPDVSRRIQTDGPPVGVMQRHWTGSRLLLALLRGVPPDLRPDPWTDPLDVDENGHPIVHGSVLLDFSVLACDHGASWAEVKLPLRCRRRQHEACVKLGDLSDGLHRGHRSIAAR